MACKRRKSGDKKEKVNQNQIKVYLSLIGGVGGGVVGIVFV